MIKHYFKIAIRNLRQQKVLSFINILGLSAGLACFSLFLLYTVNEFSYDRFHKNAKNIYRVYRWTEAIQGDPASGDVYLPMPLAPAMKEDLPDVENYVRYQEASSDNYVKIGDRIDRIKVSFADPQIFSMFSFKLSSGQPATALKDFHNIVLTEKISKRFFGNENPVGKTIYIKTEEQFEPFVVSAIADDPPSNSSLQFQALGHFDYLATTSSGKRSVNNWMRSAYFSFVQLKEGSKLATDRDALIPFRKKYYPDEEAEARKAGYWTGKGVPVRYALQPLLSIHTDTKVAGGNVNSVNPKTIWLLLSIAFAVLLIACINFTTLSIGRSASRSKEIGLRKVLGSQRPQLIWQFLAEALLLTVFSVLLGLLISYFLLPFFNQLSGKELRFSFQQFPELFWLIGGLTLIVAILSGSYPALVLSGFKPLEVLKQKIRVGGSNFFTRSLVTLQFVLSIGLIASTLIILQQLKFMRGANPGFNKENIVIINGNDVDGNKIYPLFKQAVMKDPSIGGVASSDIGLGAGEGWSRSGFDYKGKLKQVFEFFIDPEYIPLMRMQLLAGRNFDPVIMSDTVTSVIVNESMVKDFGWTIDNAVGQTLLGYEETRTPVVIGVVKDFNFRPFSEKIGPQMFHQFKGYAPQKYFVKLKPGNPSEALASLQKAWVSLVPGIPFNYSFLDENLDNFYKAEVRWGRIIGWAGGISIFLACLGLFGLAALAAVNRTKEVGIRKVLGASLSSIVRLLSKDFLKLIIVAFVIATPLAWYFMHKWLQDFAYRISIPAWIFIASSGLAIIIALLTIGSQALKAGIANPVKSLRTE
ncbi:MAG TPA: ABC transporter permease [Chitinophagaceae bacterium]|nr:ABC transporter permease [Chitinophagaceae bacterium]